MKKELITLEQIAQLTDAIVFVTGENSDDNGTVINNIARTVENSVWVGRKAIPNVKIEDITKKGNAAIVKDIDSDSHYKEQKALMQKVVGLSSKVRFIISTNSYVPILESTPKSRVLRVEKDLVYDLGSYFNRCKDAVLREIFDFPNEYGGQLEKDITEFYEMREAIYSKKDADLARFMKLARKIFITNQPIKNAIAIELRQLFIITNNPIFEL